MDKIHEVCTKSHYVFEPATIAHYAKKTVLQHFESKVIAEFIVDESWQRNVRIGKMGLK